MDFEDLFQNLVMNLIARFPVYLICFVGIIFAFVRMKRHPAVSITAAVAMALLLLCELTSLIFFPLAMRFMPDLMGDYYRFGSAMNLGVRFFSSLVFAGVLGLLFWAVFMRRVPENLRRTPDRRDAADEPWTADLAPERGRSQDITGSPQG